LKKEKKKKSKAKPRKEVARDEASPIREQTTKVEEIGTGATYHIIRKATIDCDGKPHKVTVAHLNLSVTLDYVVVPTKVSSSYLRANAVNTSSMFLLKGPLNVFMNNYFITKNELSETNPKEKFKLYLGVDQGIKVDFQPVARSESSQNSLFKKAKMETVTHTTKIRNLKKKPIIITVYDQKPFASNESIKIKIDEPKAIGGDIIVDEFNIISWTLHLQPDQESTVVYKYSLEWPLDKNIEEFEQTEVTGVMRV